jgi:hypothetical protein
MSNAIEPKGTPTPQVNRIRLKDRILIPQEAYFPTTHGAILRDYKVWNEYQVDPVTKERKQTGVQLGMTVVAVSPFMAYEHITVKIAGDLGNNFVYPSLDNAFTTGDLVYITFTDFAGSSYTMDNVTHYTGTASGVFVTDAPDKAISL